MLDVETMNTIEYAEDEIDLSHFMCKEMADILRVKGFVIASKVEYGLYLRD